MDWRRLAGEVQRRRAHLGYPTRKEFAEATGFAPKTLSDLETLKRTSFSQVTLASLEKALQWPEGRVQEILGADADPDVVVEEVPAPVDASAEFRTALGILRWLTVPKIDLADLLHTSGLDPEQLYPLVVEHRRRQAAFDRQEQVRLREEIRRVGGQVP